jgi:hypothetical protein
MWSHIFRWILFFAPVCPVAFLVIPLCQRVPGKLCVLRYYRVEQGHFEWDFGCFYGGFFSEFCGFQRQTGSLEYQRSKTGCLIFRLFPVHFLVMFVFQRSGLPHGPRETLILDTARSQQISQKTFWWPWNPATELDTAELVKDGNWGCWTKN